MEKVFYWANALDGARVVFVIFLVIALVVLAIWTGFWIAEVTEYGIKDEDAKSYQNRVLWTFGLSALLSLGVVFIPDKQTYLLMKGSKAVEEMYKNNETLQELPKNTVNLINEYVKTLTKELQEDESSN